MKEISSVHLLPRVFIEAVADRVLPLWKKEASFELSKAQAHYLGTVLRRKEGHFVRLFNGKDGEWLAQLKRLGRHGAIVSLKEKLREQAGLAKQKQLLFSPLKRDATELVIRMGTELGVVRFRPLIMARTNVHRLNEERLRLIAIEAAEQSERLDIPEILPIAPMCVTLAQWPHFSPIAVAIEREEDLPLFSKIAEKNIETILIGPEGGFSPEEKEQISKNPSCCLFSLGKQILRAETAIVSALAQIGE